MDRFSKYNNNVSAVRGQVCELELVTRLTLDNGTTQEITNLRRALCKKATRRGNVTVLEFADIDRSALDQVFPFETFTVADFPELFIDAVGKRVPQGVGTVVKVPLVQIQKSSGVFAFAGPKVLAGVAAAPLAVYRGTVAGQGAVVNAVEYTTGTRAAAVSGFAVNTVTFAREQIDFSGRPYVIEADYLLPGSRTAPDEIVRILKAYGLTVDDTATFLGAATADAAAGILVDALYGDPGRTGNAIIEDLLRVARGWLFQTTVGAWAIVQDVAKASNGQFDTNAAGDLIEISEYGDNDIPKTITGQARPRVSGTDGDYGITLQRVVGGGSGDTQLKWMYVRDAVVMDKLMSYWQKRLQKAVAKGRVFNQHLVNGSVITVTDYVSYTGTKDFILSGISRPADMNELSMREYDAAVYAYTANALPADATNGYVPDYSQTAPAAPNNQTTFGGGTSADTDGKVTAFVGVRALPPAVNWARLEAQLTDTTTNEIYQAQLVLNPGTGFYEAIVGGLRPNRLHNGIVWAVNSFGIDGTTAALAPFTTANAVIALAAPAVAATQVQSFEVNVDLGAVADVAGQPKFRRYVLFEQVSGAYVEVQRTPDRTIKRTVAHGLTYNWKARSEDVNGNESADSAVASLTPTTVINDTYIQPTGISGPSIASASINQTRTSTANTSQSGTIPAGSVAPVGSGSSSDYSYCPGLAVGNSGSKIATVGLSLVPTLGTQFTFLLINNDPGSQPYDAEWKQVTT